jgi:hypothetical protein
MSAEVDSQHLLRLRDERRAGCPDPRIDAIVIAELKGKMLTALRQAIDELGRIECEHHPALSARVDSELAWIREVIAFFAGPDA